jgi:hypothetical protein
VAKTELQALGVASGGVLNSLGQMKGVSTGFTVIDNAIAGAEKAVARFDDKLQNGSRIWQRDVDVIGQHYRRLEIAIRETFGTLNQAPAEVQAAHSRINAELERTIALEREFKDAQQEVVRRLAEGRIQLHHSRSGHEGRRRSVRSCSSRYSISGSRS